MACLQACSSHWRLLPAYTHAHVTVLLNRYLCAFAHLGAWPRPPRRAWNSRHCKPASQTSGRLLYPRRYSGHRYPGRGGVWLGSFLTFTNAGTQLLHVQVSIYPLAAPFRREAEQGNPGTLQRPEGATFPSYPRTGNLPMLLASLRVACWGRVPRRDTPPHFLS